MESVNKIAVVVVAMPKDQEKGQAEFMTLCRPIKPHNPYDEVKKIASNVIIMETIWETSRCNHHLLDLYLPNVYLQ